MDKSLNYYEICVEGELGEIWLEWFDGLSIRRKISKEDRPCVGAVCLTILYGPIRDQPALHSLLNKIRDLNMTLVSVKRVEPD